MGFGGISPFQLLIILVIVLLIFGTKKLRGLGGDLGGAIKGFKKAMKEDGSQEKPDDDQEKLEETQDGVAEKVADTVEKKADEEKS